MRTDNNLKDNTIKVTFLVRYFTIGGLERVVIALANECVARGLDTQIIIISKGKRNSLITELDKRVQIVFLSDNSLFKGFQLQKLTKGRLVHIHFGDGKIHPLIRLQLCNRKKIITYHSVYRHKRNVFLNIIDLFFSSFIPIIVAVSDAVKEFCVSDVHIAEKKISVIRNGIKIEDNYNRHNNIRKEKVITILVVASLYPHKNHSQMLDHIKSLIVDSEVNCVVNVIGDGPCMADLYLKTLKLCLEDNVNWLGAVWHKKIVDSLFAEADIFLSPSTYEGFPISILEAMNYKIPLVLSDIPSHREIGGDAALYYKLGDFYRFNKIISTLFHDAEYRNECGKACGDLIHQYDISETVDKYIKLYQKYDMHQS